MGDRAMHEDHSVPMVVRVATRLDRLLGTFETAVTVFFLAVLIAVGVYQSFASRVLGINDVWPFEVIRYSVFFIAMSGAALAAQRGEMFTMDFLSRRLGPRSRQWSALVLGLFSMAACILLMVGALFYRSKSLNLGNDTSEIISPSLGLLALPAGAALMAVHFLLHALRDLACLMTGTTGSHEQSPTRPSPP